jgi:hypothetical protein
MVARSMRTRAKTTRREPKRNTYNPRNSCHATKLRAYLPYVVPQRRARGMARAQLSPALLNALGVRPAAVPHMDEEAAGFRLRRKALVAGHAKEEGEEQRREVERGWLLQTSTRNRVVLRVMMRGGLGLRRIASRQASRFSSPLQPALAFELERRSSVPLS